MSKLNVAEFLKANAEPTGPKSKVIPVGELEQLADQVHISYEAMKDAEAAFRAVEGKMLIKTSAQ